MEAEENCLLVEFMKLVNAKHFYQLFFSFSFNRIIKDLLNYVK